MNILAQDWHCTEVIENISWDDAYFTLRVALPDAFCYEPGQFLKLGLMHEERCTFRPFSIVSIPSDHFLEFYAVKVPGGSFSPMLYALRPKAPIWLSYRSLGHLTAGNLGSGKTLWLISTGTGIAPYLSLLREGSVFQQFEQIVLIQGIRYGHQRHHQISLERLSAAYPGAFQYHWIVSRDTEVTESSGRITDLLDRGEIETRCQRSFDASGDQVILCGNPEMIKAVCSYLSIHKGFMRRSRAQAGNILLERYW